MSFLKNLFKNKDKKSLYSLAILFVAGVLLLLSSGLFNAEKETPKTITEDKAIIKMPETYSSHVLNLEKRLEDTLSLVEGAGRVKAMLTLTHGKETVVQQDINVSESQSEETDNTGGKRMVSDRKAEEKTIMVRQSDGSEIPLVLVETEPKVEGVIIIAEGGNNIIVKDAIIKAAQTVLGIEMHKVQVLKMK